MLDEEENTQRISMSLRGSNGQTVELVNYYPEDTTWMEIAKQFHNFLSAMGYVLDSERVGAEY